MPEMMKAFRLVEWEHPPELTETSIPSPGPGEVLVEVAGNGLCHSDVGMALAPAAFMEPLGWRVPFTLGHEVGGYVAELGPGAVGFAVGDPVAVISPHSCGHCIWCARGQDNNCDDSIVGRGYGIDGGLARYMLVATTRELVKLHTLDPVVAGPLTDAGATSYHAVKRAIPRIPPGGSAVVIGAGGLGAYAIQHLRALTSARIVAVDISADRRSYATELGAHDVLEGVNDDTTAELRRLLEGGANAVFDFVGNDLSILHGLQSTAKAGSYALVGAGNGSLRGTMFDKLPKDGEVFSFQAPTIADTLEVIALAEAGQLRVDVDLFPLDRVAEAYEKMEQGELRGRAVVIPD